MNTGPQENRDDERVLRDRGGRLSPFLAWFEGRVAPFPEAAPERPPSRLLPFLWHFSKPVSFWLFLMSGLTVAVALLEVMLFGFLGNVIDWLGDREPAEVFSDDTSMLLGMAFVILVLLPLVGFLQSTVLHQTVLGNFVMTIRWKAHRWMLGQSYGFYQDEFAGRVATRVMQTSLAARDVVLKVLDVLVYVGVYFAGALVLVGSFSPWMAAPFAAWLVAYALILRYFMPQLSLLSRMQADARSVMTGRVVDSYTNIMTVKLFAHAGHEAAYARDSMEGFLRTVHPQMRMVTLLQTSMSVINGVLLFSVAATGLWLWSRGVVGVGALAVAVGLVLRLEGLAHWIMWELSGLFESIGVVHDGMSMLSKTRAVQDKPDAQPLDVQSGRVAFESVTFDYGRRPRGIATAEEAGATAGTDQRPATAAVIQDLSLDIAGGEKVGLVGRSGAGKTTLTNLLLRLYDVESGRVSIDGQDVSALQQESLRRHIGVVTQDSSLLHRSVFDNIAYGRREASQDDVLAAAERANALEFIETLEDPNGRRGLDAHVGERGVKLSGGQRQRIAIARMFLKDAPILVLDEATSALDSEVEAAIQENLGALMHGKTVIAIAHRLSTIAAMDRLVVMDAGAIVQEGSHAELSRQPGLYADLWERQSGGFLGPSTALAEASGR